MGRSALGSMLVVLALLSSVSATSAKAGRLTEITIPAAPGQIADKWLPGYANPPRARVLLPDGYNPARQYPLLVLLAGLSSNYRVWSDPGEGQVAKTAEGFPGIIVMPEGGSGWYADWWNSGARDGPAWESYYVDQVIPQILARYRILPQRRWHALAGVSMGGLGTAYLGGRLPGFFGSIAVISGLVDTHLVPVEGAIESLVPEAYAGGPYDPEAVVGPNHGFYSYGHDPTKLAPNLGHTRVFMTVGNGVPTDDGQPNPRNILTDPAAEGAVIRPASDNYNRALATAGVDFTYRTHSGIHDWANFRPELQAAIAWDLFKPVAERPASWVDDTVATHGPLWDISFRFDSPPDRVVRFRRNGSRLSVSAAGSAVTITTSRGCVFQVPTPTSIEVPARACVRLKTSVGPARLRVGRRTLVGVTVTPVVAGTVVRSGRRSATADAAGVAYLHVCATTERGVRITTSAPGFARMRTTVPASGRPRACAHS